MPFGARQGSSGGFRLAVHYRLPVNFYRYMAVDGVNNYGVITRQMNPRSHGQERVASFNHHKNQTIKGQLRRLRVTTTDPQE